MSKLDPYLLALQIGKRETSVFTDYIDTVANQGLLEYKAIIQYGNKAGESLYTHVLNGVFILEQLRPALELSDLEARVLYTAFTLHDLNKVLGGQGQSYRAVMTSGNVDAEIQRLKLDAFFPDYADYLEDIRALDLAHSGHYHVDGAGLFATDDRYGLGKPRVDALKHLIRAADVVDLSHTLDESTHKQDFLFHLNTYSDVQYAFCSHRLTENRGLLSNIVHESVVTHLRDTYTMIPLLFYPDGVAYLYPRGQQPTLHEADWKRMGLRTAQAMNEMTASNLSEFVESKPSGIKIMPKCLTLGLPFEDIWRAVFNRVQRRNLDGDSIAGKTLGRLERDYEKHAEEHPEAAEAVQQMLKSEEPVTVVDDESLRRGELARAYYHFVRDHCSSDIDEPWPYVYQLLDLPKERWEIYEFFHQLWDRAYVLAKDLSLSTEELYRRLEADGKRLLAEGEQEDPKVSIFTDYIEDHVVFSFDPEEEHDFAAHLEHYIEQQHHQCVMCSSTFPTSDWMAGDVRDDITVQAFSNRLRGGPGDPKKQICALCRLQFLLEKLNYPPVRGEKMIYLHLFPYAFLTAPFIEGLRVGIQRLTEENLVERALFPRMNQAMSDLTHQRPLNLTFTARTRSDRPQPFGLYLPRYSATVGNRIIFPINPAGDNDTERFLFALWTALLIQQHFGFKVLMTDSPVAPLSKEDFGDLYVANPPLAVRGLLLHNDYAAYEDGSDVPGTLAVLQVQARSLFAIQSMVRVASSRRNPLVTLVRAMGETPLYLFYETEKLMEAYVSDSEWPLIRLSQRVFPHLITLIESKGEQTMKKLGLVLEHLAEIAWKGGLRGRSLKKNSLMAPLDEVFAKLGHQSESADLNALRAATIEDIFEHLERITEQQYRPGQRKWDATRNFVDTFYTEVFANVYGGKLHKLLADEKLIRSAYMFYIREQIPRKSDQESAGD